MITSSIFYLLATIIFYFIPWVLNTFPFNVNYPVKATDDLTFFCSAILKKILPKEINAHTIVKESVEPSFFDAP